MFSPSGFQSQNMNLVFIRICLFGCCVLASLLSDCPRQSAAGEASVAKQRSRFVFPRFDFRNGSFAQEVRVESRDSQPVMVIVSCPRDRNAAQSTGTVQPRETMELVLPDCFEAWSHSENRPGIELTSNGSVDASVILRRRRIGNTTRRIPEYARIDLIPTTEFGTSHLLFPLLALNSACHRSVELFFLSLHDNTSVTVVQKGEEATTPIILDSFETFSMKRTVLNARGIRILSSYPIAVFIFDSSKAELGRFPTTEAHISKVGMQGFLAYAEKPTAGAQSQAIGSHTPNARPQTPTAEAETATVRLQIPIAGAQFPTCRDDDFSGYFTAMQIPPDNHWGDTYRLEMMDCQSDQILVGIAGSSVNGTRVRLKEAKKTDRIIKTAGNQLTHVFLSFNKMASVDIEAEDKIHLLIYDDTQRERQADNNRSKEKVFVTVFTASKSFLPTQKMISSVCSNATADGLCSDEGPDRGRCRLTVRQQQQQQQEVHLYEDGSATTETRNEWVVKYRHDYASSQPTTSTESFYRAAHRMFGISNPSAVNAPAAAAALHSHQPHRFPMARPSNVGLTDVFHREGTTNTFRSETYLTELTFGNRVNKDSVEPSEAALQETEYNSQGYEKRSICHTSAVSRRNPVLSSTAIINVLRNYRSTAPSEETPATVAESLTAEPSSLSNTLDGTKVSSAGVPMTSFQTPLRFIYRPYSVREVKLAASENSKSWPPVTSISDTATDDRTIIVKQKVVYKALSLFVVKQDTTDTSGNKVVNYFEIDASQVDTYSAQNRGISPTVIAVITSLCGAVFFVIACILGFVITEVLCAKRKRLQRAKVSPCVDVFNAGY